MTRFNKHVFHALLSQAPRIATACLLISAASACSKDSRAGTAENPRTWAPEKLTSIRGVPATEIEALIQTKLNGPRLDRIDDDQWGHTKRLYKVYGNNPLRLTSNGLHEPRTKALTNAILSANTDGMRLDDYPIGALAQAVVDAVQALRRIASA